MGRAAARRRGPTDREGGAGAGQEGNAVDAGTASLFQEVREA